MRLRAAYAAAALVLAAIAIWLPTGWYDTIPRMSGLPPLPFSGVNLLRLICMIEALLFVALAIRATRFVSHGTNVAALNKRDAVPYDIDATAALLILAAITLVGLFLRTHNLGQDLWLDEISPIVDYSRLSAAQVIGSYLRSNNHLVNTLLLKASISMFGQSEWSVRLPAVMFGVLGIPALYWVARPGLSRIASLGAALLFATSYHHIFFSQNARGYTAYLFFALLSTGALLRALRGDALKYWILYVIAATLGMASLLLTAFVVVSHVILCVALLWMTRRDGIDIGPILRRLIGVFLIVGLLSFQIYAAAIPEAYITLTTVYSHASTGFSLWSSDFIREMIRGISAGFGSPIVALVFLIAGAIGFAALIERSWPVAFGLVLPEVVTLAVLISRGLTISPRFFLLAVPLAMLSAAGGLAMVIDSFARRQNVGQNPARIGWAAALLVVAAASLKSLPYYYRTPKQPYRAAIAYTETHGNGGPVMVIAYAATGARYYIPRAAVSDSSRYVYVTTRAQFDSLSSDPRASRAQLMTTFERALRMEAPTIDRDLLSAWKRDTTFSATVGDGEITIWSKR
ncbi:MAG TPA: glycosyltransferase family 39 protein [Gemmatimonadaceae bacterium]|nr:glycosyltransferase family 39 protein [Gemmatimonadaceae bacterium]